MKLDVNDPLTLVYLLMVAMIAMLLVSMSRTGHVSLSDCDVIVQFGVESKATVIRADKVVLTDSWCIIERDGKSWAVIPERCNVLPAGNVKVNEAAPPALPTPPPPLPSVDGPE